MHRATHTHQHTHTKCEKEILHQSLQRVDVMTMHMQFSTEKRYAKQKFYTQEIIKGSQVLRYSSHQNKSLHPMVGYHNSPFIAIQ